MRILVQLVLRCCLFLGLDLPLIPAQSRSQPKGSEMSVFSPSDCLSPQQFPISRPARRPTSGTAFMLRPRPTVIFLTHADITEVVHRRRFRRFLEYDNDDACVTLAPTDPETTHLVKGSKSSSSRTFKYDKTPEAYDSAGYISPSPPYSRIRPLIADLPLPLPTGMGAEGNTSSSPNACSSQTGSSTTRRNQQRGSVWAPQLCLRPKRSVPPAATAVADIDTGGAIGSRDPLGCPQRESTNDGSRTERSRAASTCSDPESPTITAPSQSTPDGHACLLSDGTDARKDDTGQSTQQHGMRSESFTTPLTASPSSACDWARSVGSSKPGGNEESRSDVSSPVLVMRTPGRLRVYNDSLTASSQPQTPLEARHQSQLQAHYTAPVRRTPPHMLWARTTTWSRRHFGRRREPSPLGLQSPGFRGLYGSVENRDDAELGQEMAEDMTQRWGGALRPRPSSTE
ncbi:hypothetical protein L209DRAFT_755660 [Thermothelomyces heterothallicus CBS 203.75]